MKIIVTESQYNIITKHSGVVGPTIESGKGNSLKEQNLSLMAGDYNMYNQPGKAAPFLTPHEALQATGLVAGLFIGATEVYAAGVLLSSLFGAADSALYYREGDKESAVLAGSFALLPYIGKGVSKIPGVKELGTKGMAMLASKLSSGTKLNNVESQVVRGINAKKSLIQQELKTVTPKLSEVNQTVKSMRKPYIEKFGQQKYDELLEQFISGKLNKDEFLKTLSSTKKTGVVQGKKVWDLERKSIKQSKVARDYGKIKLSDNLELITKPRFKDYVAQVKGLKNPGDYMDLKKGVDAVGDYYYMSTKMSNPIDAGKAFQKLMEYIPKGSRFGERIAGSLSTDSFYNMLRRAKTFQPKVIGKIRMNSSGVKRFQDLIKNEVKSNVYPPILTFKNSSDAAPLINALNTEIQKAGINASAAVSRNAEGFYEVLIPNIEFIVK